MMHIYTVQALWGHPQRWPSLGQERSQEKPNCLTCWSWTFRLQNCKIINFYCSSYPFCIILLWQPLLTNTFQTNTYQGHNDNNLKIGKKMNNNNKTPAHFSPFEKWNKKIAVDAIFFQKKFYKWCIS